MNRVPNNKKVIFLLSALCCLLLVCVNIYQQKTWRSMDLIIFMGQSNMSGAGGDASAAPKLTEGAGYEYRAVTDPDTLHVLEEPFGEKENRGALDDTELLERKGSLVTSFVNAYYEQTKVPVVAVSASRGSSSLNGWLTKGLKEETADRLNAAKDCMKKEKIHVYHTYMVWFKGEADANLETTVDEYKAKLAELVSYMKEQGVEKCFLIQLGPDLTDPAKHQAVMDAQLAACEENENLILVSTLPAELTDADLRDELGIHYNQEALNLIGADAGKNAGAYVKEHGSEK